MCVCVWKQQNCSCATSSMDRLVIAYLASSWACTTDWGSSYVVMKCFPIPNSKETKQWRLSYFMLFQDIHFSPLSHLNKSPTRMVKSSPGYLEQIHLTGWWPGHKEDIQLCGEATGCHVCVWIKAKIENRNISECFLHTTWCNAQGPHQTVKEKERATPSSPTAAALLPYFCFTTAWREW